MRSRGGSPTAIKFRRATCRPGEVRNIAQTCRRPVLSPILDHSNTHLAACSPKPAEHAKLVLPDRAVMRPLQARDMVAIRPSLRDGARVPGRAPLPHPVETSVTLVARIPAAGDCFYSETGRFGRILCNASGRGSGRTWRRAVAAAKGDGGALLSSGFDAQGVGGRDHWGGAIVDGLDDLGVVDPAQIHGRHPEIGMPELALDDDQWDALARRLDRVGVAQLMGRKPPTHPGRGRCVAQLDAHCGLLHGRPRVGPRTTQNRVPTGSWQRICSHGSSCWNAQRSIPTSRRRPPLT